MSNPPPQGWPRPILDSGSPTTNHGPAAHQTRVYQSDRASRTACRTATHPADHKPRPTNAKARNCDAPLDKRLSISVSWFPPGITRGASAFRDCTRCWYRPISSVRLPRSARSLSSSRGLPSRDSFGDQAQVRNRAVLAVDDVASKRPTGWKRKPRPRRKSVLLRTNGRSVRGDLRRSRSQTAKRKRAFVCQRH